MMATAEQRQIRYERTRQEHQHQWLISKLRWMGLEQEADKLAVSCDASACKAVPGETD